jgi:hypothetical protein
MAIAPNRQANDLERQKSRSRRTRRKAHTNAALSKLDEENESLQKEQEQLKQQTMLIKEKLDKNAQMKKTLRNGAKLTFTRPNTQPLRPNVYSNTQPLPSLDVESNPPDEENTTFTSFNAATRLSASNHVQQDPIAGHLAPNPSPSLGHFTPNPTEGYISMTDFDVSFTQTFPPFSSQPW